LLRQSRQHGAQRVRPVVGRHDDGHLHHSASRGSLAASIALTYR
jgi:hypothetical protein